jgi:Putative zinc ribbon domain
MPLGPGFHGTEADAAETPDYCTFCYQSGTFTQPDITVGQMVDSSVSFMVGNLKFEEGKAREMSEAVIPTLKRWRIENL